MIFVILKNNYYENQAISTYPISMSLLPLLSYGVIP